MNKELNAAEAVYGFVGWLTSREERTVMSAKDDCAPIAELIKRFCTENNLPEVSDQWPLNLIHPSGEVAVPNAVLAKWGTPAPVGAADSVQEDAARWREHVGKLDALVAYCPTCCQGFIAKQDMTRDEVLFACGKAVGQSGAKRLREALDLAVDHIDMDALRISHCKDAAVIDAARKQGEKQ